VGDTSNVSAEALGMLVDAAPFALSSAAGVAPTHAHVDTIASFIRAALEGPKTQAVEQCTTVGARVEEARAELHVVEQAQGVAIDAAKAAKDAVHGAMKAVRRAELAVKKGEADLKAAEASHAERRAARALDEAVGHRALEVMECDFSALASCIADAESRQTHLNKVTHFLQDVGAEESLVVSIPAICVKPIAKRTQWDLLALDECKRTLEKHKEAMLTKIQVSLKAEREAEAEALGEAAIQWVNARRVAESHGLLEDAEVKVAATDKQVSKAFQTVESHQTVVDYLLKENKRWCDKVRNIEENLAVFERLRNPAPCPTEETPPFVDTNEVAVMDPQPSIEEKAVIGKDTEEADEALAATLLSKPTPCR